MELYNYDIYKKNPFIIAKYSYIRIIRKLRLF